MGKRIVITGATGLIGRRLTHELSSAGHRIVACGRNIEKVRKILPNVASYAVWNEDCEKLSEIINGADAVFHLAGETLAQRWTRDAKLRILNSRKQGASALAEAIIKAKNPPSFLFSASAIGFYGDAGDNDVDESSPAGADFPAKVCKEWEKAALTAAAATRVVCGRIGIVLDKKEGALSKLLPAFRLFAGGSLGSGRQWWSWAHPSDVVGIAIWAMENENLLGAVNICSPNPLRMRDFAGELSAVLRRPAWLNIPAEVLKLTLGEMAVIALSSQKVYPKRAMQSGYRFKFDSARAALENILQ